MLYLEWLAYGLIGTISGFLAGLLGIGGGIVAIPGLFFCLGYFGIESEHLMHITIATSLASMIFSSLSSTLAHQKRKNIHWAMVKSMLFGLTLGSFVGAYIAKLLPTQTLALIFGIFLAAISIRFFLPASSHQGEKKFVKPNIFYTNIMGLSLGSVSALLGIGGGLFTVPLLTACKMHLRKAVGTSAATSFMITLLGSLAYFMLGFHELAPDESGVGFIYLPAFFMMSLCSFFTAPLGVKVAHAVKMIVIQRVFACLLLCVGISMILKSLF